MVTLPPLFQRLLRPSVDMRAAQIALRKVGRPRGSPERLHFSPFFFRMNSWGMNVFMYAPKDDDKHRADWRDLYTLEEAGKLGAGIPNRFDISDSDD